MATVSGEAFSMSVSMAPVLALLAASSGEALVALELQSSTGSQTAGVLRRDDLLVHDAYNSATALWSSPNGGVPLDRGVERRAHRVDVASRVSRLTLG